MPTYRTTALNKFRTPSGAIGEAPDGPGGMATLADDIDSILGVAGAEAAANLAAITAIPAGRTFLGKRAVAADTGYVYRYMGSTNGWVLWDMVNDWTAFTYLSGFSNSASDSISLRWAIREGALHIQGIVFGTFVSGTTTAVTAAAPGIPAPYRTGATKTAGLTFGAASQSGKSVLGNLGQDGHLSFAWNNMGTATTAPAWMSVAAAIPYNTAA